ncbi:PP2C family protein-serine/threonine phosphatase [Fimbriiglobus ruber]|uniref:Serine phosphatase RsbU, regulator of sigma subunit n=1 Tax=Fimbriiglobus ruber TaxID=1908690 RepID=A0A225ECB0_9BACT|nr:SpoIIE family protein phosphatase [Fimbriiglobus ruber]OWK46969.1 Serine phosphatase RsbU, regulator of sigma subunit [Fimbriiglobus ruber]
MALPELTVRQVMDTDPVTVAPDCTVQEVLRLMNQRRIGSVLVIRDEDHLAGIFTERDLLRRVAGAVPGWREYPVSQWMTSDPYTIGPDVGWDEAVGKMHKLRVRHMPVIEDGRVIGIISTRLLMSRRTEYLNRKVEERTAELKHANDQLIARDAELLFNIRAAGRLQNKVLLPGAPPDWPELRWAVHFAPLDHLGGDYYDFAVPDADHLGFLIADASGHSIPAAMVAIMTRFAFAQASAASIRPGAVLTEMNRRLQELTEERFVTAFYGVYDRRTGVFRYATAGHPHPLRFEAKSGAVKPLVADGFLLGVIPDEVYAEREVVLEAGDKVFFYTDGLHEARNEIGEMFGTARLIDCLTSCGGEPANDVLRHVLACQQAFCGSNPSTDDVTLAVMDIVP